MMATSICSGAIRPGMDIRAKSWVMPGALLDIDFANDRAFVGGAHYSSISALLLSPNASFDRGTSKWHRSSQDAFVEVSANIVAGDSRGVSLEPAATELIPRNHIAGETPGIGGAALAIAGWGQVGGATGFAELKPTQSIMGISTQPQVINGGDAAGYQGWKTANPITFAPGDYVFSFAARRAPGKSGFDVYWYAPVGLSGVHKIVSAAELTDQWQMFEIKKTAIASGSTTCQIIKTQQLDASFGVEFALPSLRSNQSSSPILTTGATANRAADQFNLNISDGNYEVEYLLSDGSVVSRATSVTGGLGLTLPTDFVPQLLSRATLF